MKMGQEGQSEMAKDPICGMMVNEKTTQFRSEHEGMTFYFCSAQCKKTFDSDPHRYGHR
jgi:Cu+-exporting ATPase